MESYSRSLKYCVLFFCISGWFRPCLGNPVPGSPPPSGNFYLLTPSLIIKLYKWFLTTAPAWADGDDILPEGDEAPVHLHCEAVIPDQSEASIMVAWLPMTNQRPVLLTRDMSRPITGRPPSPPASWCCTSPALAGASCPGPGCSRAGGGRNYQQLELESSCFSIPVGLISNHQIVLVID